MESNLEEINFKEISQSVCRYLKYTQQLEEKYYILYLGEKSYTRLCNSEDIQGQVKEIEIKEFIKEILKDPHPIYILGFENEPLKNEEFLDKLEFESIRQFRFFYKIFRDFIGYISTPFNPKYITIHDSKKFENSLKKVQESLEGLLKNNKLKDLLGEAKINTEKEKIIIEIFTKLGCYLGIDIKTREKIIHEARGQGEVNFLIQLASMFAGLIKLVLEKGSLAVSQREKIKLLLIDNNPAQNLKNIDERYSFLKNDIELNEIFLLFSPIIETYIFDGKVKNRDFSWFLNELKKRKEKKGPFDFPCKKCGDYKEIEYEYKALESFDAILVDMYLNSGQPDGLEILKELTEAYPEIPAFVLSVSDDFALIRRAIKHGADYYIIKNQTFSIPYMLWDYMKSIGEILEYIDDSRYRRNLYGNIRYWHFKKNLLWFGDKCYHMIDHSFNHTLDDWQHLNQILVPLIDSHGKEKFFNDEKLLYALCMAIWLHDIGHKGNSYYGEPHIIRDNHGYISGELILKYPEVFRIEDKDNYYKNFDFSKVSAIEVIFRRKDIKELSVTEMIALFTMYHKSNAPIDRESFHKLWSNPKKRIPLDYYINREPKYENILTLERILEERENKIKNEFLKLMALFRFIDSIDIRAIRVGDITEEKLKKIVIKNDKEYQYYKLMREVKNLSRFYTKSPIESTLFVKSFYDDAKDKIEKGEFISFDLSKELIKDPEILVNYESLIDYAAFIALQPDHFDLHSSVTGIKFEYYNRERLLSITLLTDKEVEWLKEHKVKERGRREQTIWERLIGENNYIFTEIRDVREYLREFFMKMEVILQHERGEILKRREEFI